MNERPEPKLERIAGLDGVRGVAVLVVVAYHLDLIRGGFLGVDIFFVLSGFLVTSLLLVDARHGSVRLGAFWIRRARRLVPAVLAMVPIVLVAAMATGWPRTRMGEATVDGFATLTWWANWRQVAGPSYWAIDTPSLFRHAWSLSVEEQFYVLWPLALCGGVWFARRGGRSVKAGVAAVCGLGIVLSAGWMVVLARRLDASELSRVYVGTDTRVFAPLVGCLLACWWSARHRSIERLARRSEPGEFTRILNTIAVVAAVGLGALILLVEPSDAWLYRSGGFFLASVLAAVLVAVVLLSTTFARGRPLPAMVGWTTASPVRYLGLRSYAIYLWSWPVQVLLEHKFPDAPRWLICIAVVAAVLGLAEASHHLVEHPVRHGTRWSDRGRRQPAFLAGVALPLLAIVVAAAWAEEPPVHEQVTTREAVEDGLHRQPPAPDATAAPDDVTVMVTGDSVAYTVGSYAPIGDQLPDGIASVDTRGIQGCGIATASGHDYFENYGWMEVVRGGCDQQYAVEEVGLHGHPDVVLLVPGAWDYEAVRAPDGTEYASQSPELADLLVQQLVTRATKAHSFGARFVMLEWACPGADQKAARRDPDYIRWINRVIDRAAKSASRDFGVDASVLATPEAVCVNGDPAGEPTAARDAATPDGMHVENEVGGYWFWSQWIAPALRTHGG